MNPDQTAPFGSSDLGPYCLQYRLPKNISRQEEQMIKVVTGWLRSKSNILKINFKLHSKILHKSTIDEMASS